MGLASMQRTELARFLIRPEYAFGEMGCPPRIPPNATSKLFGLCLVSSPDPLPGSGNETRLCFAVKVALHVHIQVCNRLQY